MNKKRLALTALLGAALSAGGIHPGALAAAFGGGSGTKKKSRVITEADLDRKQAAEEKRLRKNAKRLAQKV